VTAAEQAVLEDATTFLDVIQVSTAALGIAIAGLVALMPFLRRPRLSIQEDTARIHSRLESTDRGKVPHLRLLAGNAKWKRSAKEARILVEGYQRRGSADTVSLAYPSLGWPSAPEASETAAVTIFAGGFRPVGLARFIRVRLDAQGQIMRPHAVDAAGRPVPGFPHYPDDADATGWYLWLDLAFGLDILDNRDKLEPVEGGYTVELMIGADDGAARRFAVDVAWDGAPDRTPDQVLNSALERLAVREI
jgi:hypothetical protein